MYKLVSGLLMYGDLPHDSILHQLCDICREVDSGSYDRDSLLGRVYRQVKRLLVLATDYGFNRNLWHCYLTYLLMTSENPFTLTCEKVGAHTGSVNQFVKNDFEAFRALFHYDFTTLEAALGTDVFRHLLDYTAIAKPEHLYNKNVSEKLLALSERLGTAADSDAFFEAVTDFYRDYGVGAFGLNKAFRIVTDEHDRVVFQPIAHMDNVRLTDLIGYDSQKAELCANTRAFVEGRKANNVLLYGDSGTGKSTSIKAIVNEFYDQGLRMIEIYKHQFRYLSDVIAQIKNRNYKFIIYMDDLSFEEFEVDYKFLKAVIEGGVETRPDNILIYATSNRRHLVKETWKDRNDMEYEQDIHRSDSMEEKLSLAYRFGVSILYTRPSRDGFRDIVTGLAARHGITMPEDELMREANKWELRHGGISGRAAQQFVNRLLGQEETAT